MKLLVAAALVSFILTSGAIAQSAKEDGFLWQRASNDFKIAWIGGFVAGTSEGQIGLMILAQQPGVVTKKVTVKNVKGYIDYDGIRYSQYFDGMNALYKDYRNDAISLRDAMQYVRDSVRGNMTQRSLQEEIEKDRRNASQTDSK